MYLALAMLASVKVAALQPGIHPEDSIDQEQRLTPSLQLARS